MKTSALAATVFASLVAAASPYWYITGLQTLDTTSTTLESSLQFTFEDASTSLTTKCSYVNSQDLAAQSLCWLLRHAKTRGYNLLIFKLAQRLGRLPSLFSIWTLRKSKWFRLQSHIWRANAKCNQSGNLQGEQNGTGIADLACQADEAQSGTTCYAQNTEIIPGPESGA